MSISQPKGIRVRIPEPLEIGNWFTALWLRLWAYFRVPEHQAIWAVMLLAAILRLSYLNLIEFKADEVHHLENAWRILHEGALPLTGTQASMGIAKPPLMSYLLVIPMLFGRDPRIASGFIALLNIAGIAGLFSLVRRYHGLRPAILASALLAANPWAVVFSRKIFTADILLPFGVPLLYGLYQALVDENPWGWVLTFLSLGIMLNITFSPALLIPAIGLLLAIYRHKVRWLHVLLGLSLATLISGPYLYYLNNTRLADVRQLMGSMGTGTGESSVSPNPLNLATWLHSNRHLASLAGTSAGSFLPYPLIPYMDRLGQGLFLAALVAVAVLALYAWGHWKKQDPPAKYAILTAWLWVPLVLLLWARPSWLELQYLVILYPAGFLTMGLVLDRVLAIADMRTLRWRWGSPLLRFAFWLVILAIVGWQAYSTAYLFDFVEHMDTSGGYDLPYRFWLRVANMTRREARAAGTDQVWIVTDGADISYEAAPAILNYLLQPDIKPIFLGQGDNDALLLPAERPGVYLLTRTSPLVEDMLNSLRAEERGLVISPGGRVEARLKVAPAHKAVDMLAAVQHRGLWMLDSGLLLVGYDWPKDAKAGDVVRMATYWMFTDVPSQERQVQHSLFNHLIDSTGEKVAQSDGLGLPERYWQPGLLLKQWFELQLPADLSAGDYTLSTGLYRLDDWARNRQIDDQGHDLGDSIHLGPIHLDH